MSVKVYTNFFLSPGGYNLKISYLKDKMRHNVSSYLAEQYGVILIATRVLLCHRRSKYYEKLVKFYPEISKFKDLVQSNNLNKFDFVT